MLYRILHPNFKSKFILSLLTVSLASMAAVAWFSHYLLMQKFDDLYRKDASQRFALDVTRYIEAYGSWQSGLQHESFRSFTDRNRPVNQVPVNQTPRKEPEPSTVPAGTPAQHISNLSRPPFRFYLFDPQYHALFKLSPYKIGDLANAEHRASVKPILANGQIAAYYVPEGKISYSDLDLGYQAAVREALWTGVVVAGVLALILGWVLGGRLGMRLNKLTQAVQAMKHDQLQQKVEISGHDEINTLADAFNQMSAHVAQSDQALRESHAQVEKQAEQLRELSIRDGLTQLYNRRYFDEQGTQLLTQAARYGRPFSVMIGDIDFFKKINDQYSHAMGDEVLRKVSEILSTKVRSTDLVARYGGEEFVIAFPETTLQQAQSHCETLRRRIESYPWHTLHPDLKVTMSMGVSADIKAADLHNMLKLADELLYKAKHGGRNQVCC